MNKAYFAGIITMLVALMALGAVALNQATNPAVKMTHVQEPLTSMPVEIESYDTVPCSSVYSSGLPILKSSPVNGSSPLRLAFFMKSNSTMQICIRYTSNEQNNEVLPLNKKGDNPISRNLFPFEQVQEVRVVAVKPDLMPLKMGTSRVVTYTIAAAGSAKGVYWFPMNQWCDSIPIVVDLKISDVSPSDFPVYMGVRFGCGTFLDTQIVGSSDAEVSYVATNGINLSTDKSPEHSASPINGAFPPPSLIINSIVIGHVRDVAEASAVVGFNVKSPAYLPQGYHVQIVHANPESKEVAMLAWDKVVTEQTSYTEFLYQGKGIIIYLTQQSPDYNMTKNINMWLQDNAKYGAHKITVNGFPGVAYDHQTVTTELGDQVLILTEVIFFKNDLMVKVRGDLPEVELTKVAQSMS